MRPWWPPYRLTGKALCWQWGSWLECSAWLDPKCAIWLSGESKGTVSGIIAIYQWGILGTEEGWDLYKWTRPLCCHSIFWLPSKNQDWKSGQLLTITATYFEKVKPVFLFPKIHTSNENLLVAVKDQVLKAKDFKLRPCSSKGSPGPAHLSETQNPNQDGVSKAL